jgi:hypothetical protein
VVEMSMRRPSETSKKSSKKRSKSGSKKRKSKTSVLKEPEEKRGFQY